MYHHRQSHFFTQLSLLSMVIHDRANHHIHNTHMIILSSILTKVCPVFYLENITIHWNSWKSLRTTLNIFKAHLPIALTHLPQLFNIMPQLINQDLIVLSSTLSKLCAFFDFEYHVKDCIPPRFIKDHWTIALKFSTFIHNYPSSNYSMFLNSFK